LIHELAGHVKSKLPALPTAAERESEIVDELASVAAVVMIAAAVPGLVVSRPRRGSIHCARSEATRR
jgi:hypothetical protein